MGGEQLSRVVLLVIRLKSTKYFFSWNWELEKYNVLSEIWILQDSFISKEILSSFDLNRANFPVSIAKISSITVHKETWMKKNPLRKIDMHLIHLHTQKRFWFLNCYVVSRLGTYLYNNCHIAIKCIIYYIYIIMIYVYEYIFFLQLRQKILEAHANVKDLNLLEAKMNFIKAWQSLPDFGVSLFVVRFHGEKRDELLGIAYNRIMRMSLQTGDHLKTWRYNTIKVSKI